MAHDFSQSSQLSQPPRYQQRFTQRSGSVHLTGLQALARLPLDQVRRDRKLGLRMGGYLSGYPGSPLAGFDRVLREISPLLDQHGLRFQMGMNEELAAAAVAGSQLVDLFPHEEWDGVIGMWYGKAPGIDRCLDVLRHANFTGISRFGGALAVVGDDPACKSSSLPSQSEQAFAHAMIPLLVPGGAAEVLELGLHGYALSRFAGVWAGLKLVADVCDGGEIVELCEDTPQIVVPDVEIEGRPFQKRLDPRLLPPTVLEIERHLVFERLEAARRYVYENGLDRIENSGTDDRVGLVAVGVHHRELLGAFRHLGLDAAELRRLGIRVLRLAMVYPLEPRRLREFARGLSSVVVLDDRRGFLEEQIRACLYELDQPPRIFGQRDAGGAPWLARRGALAADTLACDLGGFLASTCRAPELEARAAQVVARGRVRSTPVTTVRRPHFCSGCPHLTSTRVPDGLAVAGGIGCHTMALLTEREMRFFGAMGSEGAHWTGLSPFVDTPHLFQNLGDGTYFHSGRQSIRASVAAGATLTYKLLYNGAIAMTGGQRATGEKAVAPLVRDLLSDGVRKVVAMSDDPALLDLAEWNEAVEVIARDEIDSAMEKLAREQGVSVFVYDAMCAIEKQRRERRGLLPAPSERIWIQQDVCEGCGDCGRRSECPSVRPVSTALGRKTQIHQGSCSQDEACLAGDCPAFLTLGGDASLPGLPLPENLGPPEQDPPLPEFDESFSILMIGVGSTGVVTVDAILMAAVRNEGLHGLHLDQTGLSQRGGRVSSHCRISRRPLRECARVPWGGADTLLAFDPICAADAQGLPHLSSQRTHTVLHDSLSPTAEMVSDIDRPGPSLASLRATLEEASRELHALAAEEIATAVLGEHQCANILLLGFAFQHGAIPLSSRSIELAIEENDVRVDTNLRAFRLGRCLAVEGDLVRRLLRAARPLSVGADGDPAETRARFGELWNQLEALVSGQPEDEEGIDLCSRIAGLALDLRDYQNHRYAERYLRALLPLVREEHAQRVEILKLTPVVARELYRLMAYKDEYEVARLHLRGPFRRWLDRRSGRRVHPTYWLHPPLLRSLGLTRKLRLGPWFELGLRGLVALRRLRGTAFDVFGASEVRRVERELVDWYEELMMELARRLESMGVDVATEIAEMAAAIRGYESLKIERAALARERVEKALEARSDL
ncbi:MAG: indolepyruvate ferredoxin oxidoreductase family protein [Myxococcota bacterium]